MPRWYKGFRCGGIRPQGLVNMIALQVQRYDIGDFVPVLHVEKRSGPAGFYFFLAIESPVIGQVPEEIQSALFHLPSFREPIDQPFTFDDIRRMVSAELSVYDYVRMIPYTSPVLPPMSDPFNETLWKGDKAQQSYRADIVRSKQYDRFLLWLSGVRSGSWRIFENTWRMLAASNTDSPQQVLRKLRLLGHLETSPDRTRWAIAPAVLVEVSCGDHAESLVLCGRRDSRLLQELHHLATLEEQSQDRDNGPSTTLIQTQHSELLVGKLREAGHNVQYGGSAAATLAKVLPPLLKWKDSLEALEGIRTHNFIVKRFDGTTFTETHFNGASGLYELWSLDSDHRKDAKPEYILFYDDIRGSWLRSDWYGLRFLARQVDGQQCTVAYNTATGQLAVPTAWHWPELYERALVLASGRLPSYRNERLVYEAIDQNLLNELSGKLNLHCEELSHA